MNFRSLSLLLMTVVVALVVGSAVAEDKAAPNSHEGLFIAAEGDGFLMSDKDGNEHRHTLAADAVVLGEDGKACKITDYKKGTKIRVTTKEGDATVAVKVEWLKA